MKAQYKRAALFIAGLTGLLAFASAYYEFQVRRDDFFRQVEWFRSPDVQPFVLFLGDSRLAANLRNDRLPAGFYNWSHPRETLRHLYLRAKYALETKPSLRYLVIGLDDLTLSQQRARLRDIDDHLLFADLADVRDVYPVSPRFMLRNVGLFYVPLLNVANRRFLGKALTEDVLWLATVTVTPEPTYFVNGDIRFTRRSDWPLRPPEQRSAMAAQQVQELLGERNDTAELRAVLNKLLALAERRGVKVIGLRSPLSAEYHRHARSFDVDAVLAAYDQAHLYAQLDYAELLSDRADYFQDPGHLNDLGATAFTDRVAQDLRQIVASSAILPASARRASQAVRPEPLSWPYNDILSPLLASATCSRWNLGCRPMEARTQVASADAGAFAAVHDGGRSIMNDSLTYFWPGVLLATLLLGWWTLDRLHERRASGPRRKLGAKELELTVCTTRIELARAIIGAQFALLKTFGCKEEPPELAALRCCPQTTIEMFRRLSAQSRIIFDGENAQAAADAWTLHDLGLAVIRQRLPSEIEIAISPAAMSMLDRQRAEELRRWHAHNGSELARRPGA